MSRMTTRSEIERSAMDEWESRFYGIPTVERHPGGYVGWMIDTYRSQQKDLQDQMAREQRKAMHKATLGMYEQWKKGERDERHDAG